MTTEEILEELLEIHKRKELLAQELINRKIGIESRSDSWVKGEKHKLAEEIYTFMLRHHDPISGYALEDMFPHIENKFTIDDAINILGYGGKINKIKIDYVQHYKIRIDGEPTTFNDYY